MILLSLLFWFGFPVPEDVTAVVRGVVGFQGLTGSEDVILKSTTADEKNSALPRTRNKS